MTSLPDTMLCRVCEKKSVNFIKLDSLLLDGTSIIDAFNELTRLQAALCDPLPQLVCQMCVDELRDALEFLHTAQITDRKFRQLMDPLDTVSLNQSMEELVMEEYLDEETLEDYTLDNTIAFGSDSSVGICSHLEITAQPFIATHNVEVLSDINKNEDSQDEVLENKNENSEDMWYDDYTREDEEVSDGNDILASVDGKCSSFKCDTCKKIFTEETQLQVHVLAVHDSINNKCVLCQKELPSIRHLRYHILAKHIDKTPDFKCRYCAEVFSTHSDLKAHSVIHAKRPQTRNRRTKNTFECNICFRRYKTEVRQKMHELIEHRNSDTVCSFCQKEYPSLCRLRAHILNVHVGKRAYDCDICGLTLTTSTQLRTHKLVHTGERPHICEWCGESFNQRSILNTHRVLHTGKTIKCSVCSKMFCRPSELRLHMRTHTGERPFSCDQCGRSYTNRYQLSVHLDTHIGFNCEQCDKVYTTKSRLKVHINQDHGENPQSFNCDQCCKTFNSIKSYRNHMRTKHNVYKNAAAADKQLIKETGEEEN